jgi:hypothetical protein
MTDNYFQRSILAGLNNLNRHIYMGTVPEHVKAKRRAKNRVAKASRKRNR